MERSSRQKINKHRVSDTLYQIHLIHIYKTSYPKAAEYTEAEAEVHTEHFPGWPHAEPCEVSLDKHKKYKIIPSIYPITVQFSRSVMSNSLRPYESQHTRLPQSTQIHVHRVSNVMQPSHPLSSASPPALNLSQHQGLFNWVSYSHQVAKVLEFQLQYQSFQWTPRTDLL